MSDDDLDYIRAVQDWRRQHSEGMPLIVEEIVDDVDALLTEVDRLRQQLQQRNAA